MALVLNDRVRETSTTTGTGTLDLAGAVSGFETFVTGIGDNNTTYYAIVNRSADEWELGVGTVDDQSTDTLARTTVLSSSNSDSAVDFSAGVKDVFVTLPASKSVHEDASANVTLPNDLLLASDSSVLKFGADSDTTLTHTDGTGLTLNSTNKLTFRDAALYVNSSTDGQLDIVADTEIQIAATTVDINGNVEISGDLTVTGDDITMGTNTAGHLLIADGTNFNSVAATSLTEISTVANDDVFLAVDTSGGGLKKITRSTIVSGLAVGGVAISNVVEDTTPQLGGNLDTNDHNILIDDAHGILDDSSNEQLIFQKTSSAVNHYEITNQATGSSPTIGAVGGDSNINVVFVPKGTGETVIGTGSATATLTTSGAQDLILDTNSGSNSSTITITDGSNGNIALAPNGTGVVLIDGQVGIEAGIIDLKNSGSTVSKILFYCESSNAHAQTLIGAPHAESASNTLTLPSTGGNSRLLSAASTATLTNKTLTAAKIADGGFIADANGNELVVFQTTGSAVNELEITNNASGSNPILAATGGDTNIGITLTPKGTGEIVIAAGNLNYAGTAVTSTGAELNILDGVTSTAAELNILDGVTSTAAELNILDGVTSTAAELNILDGVTSTAAELNLVDGITAGTISASLAVIVDSNKDITGFRNVTLTGELDAGSLDISGNADIDGTLEADAITVDGTAIGSLFASQGDATALAIALG